MINMLLLAWLFIPMAPQDFGSDDVLEMMGQLEEHGIRPEQAEKIAGITVAWMQRVMGRVDRKLSDVTNMVPVANRGPGSVVAEWPTAILAAVLLVFGFFLGRWTKRG